MARKGEVDLSPEAIGLLRAARVALRWTQDDLAREARISVGTIKRLELGDDERLSSLLPGGLLSVRKESVDMILGALRRHGVEIWSKGASRGIILRGNAGHIEFPKIPKD